MARTRGVRAGQVSASNAEDAVRQFCALVQQPRAALVVFFCSAALDLRAVAAEMERVFNGIRVVGCTTAGEIGPMGYRTRTIAGASFASDVFCAVHGRIDALRAFTISQGQALARQLLRELQTAMPQAGVDNTFAFQMIDGLSAREEPVSHAFQTVLGRIPVVGGSAGDGLDFASTQVYCDGQFHRDSAVLVLVTTSLPFKPFLSQHFAASDRRVVITKADAAKRRVYEIDGLPAALVYAELLGTDTQRLDPTRFAASPLVVVIGGANYVRSIRAAHPDGSLEFYCAIDEGMVLRVARSTDLVSTLEQSFAAIVDEIGPPQAIIGCDCVLRRVEIEQRGLRERVGDLMQRHHVVGFNTYGEQYRGVHVNQTFTGLAIGDAQNVGQDRSDG